MRPRPLVVRLYVCLSYCYLVSPKEVFVGFLWSSLLISLQQVVEKREFVKFGPVAVVCTVLEGVNKFLPALS
jgi:hypothetical protein